jgi:hypothetical protein
MSPEALSAFGQCVIDEVLASGDAPEADRRARLRAMLESRYPYDPA